MENESGRVVGVGEGEEKGDRKGGEGEGGWEGEV